MGLKALPGLENNDVTQDTMDADLAMMMDSSDGEDGPVNNARAAKQLHTRSSSAMHSIMEQGVCFHALY